MEATVRRSSADYPFSGKVRFTIGLEKPTSFALCLRVPNWVKGQPVPSDLYRFARRLPALEEGLLKAMKHSVYQGYLKTVGLGPDSVVGAADWDAQIKQLYKDGAASLKELGMIK